MEPLILNGKHPSRCCEQPTILVRSRDGGFVTQNCSNCGVPRGITLKELPELACGRCGQELTVVKHQNYFYKRAPCGLSHALHALIPAWNEWFTHNGYYLDGDGERWGT